MSADTPFRIAIAFLFLAALSISGFYRRRAASTGERISGRGEGLLILLVLRGSGLLMFASVTAYVIHPSWIGWASVPLPHWLRFRALGVGVAVVPLVTWTLSSLGKNITPTVAVRHDHFLVTHGPYRWIRHPLYTFGTIVWASAAIMAASGLMAVLILLGAVGLLLRTPKEEAHLIERFGDEYREYAKRTGRYLPRIFSRARPVD